MYYFLPHWGLRWRLVFLHLFLSYITEMKVILSDGMGEKNLWGKLVGGPLTITAFNTGDTVI